MMMTLPSMLAQTLLVSSVFCGTLVVAFNWSRSG